MSTKTCTKCSSSVPIQANFCNICGNNSFNEGLRCDYCKKSLPSKNPKFCPSCGKRIGEGVIKMKLILAPDGKEHACGICRQNIGADLVFCPSCINPFHFPHLANWILEKQECPICKTKLVFAND